MSPNRLPLALACAALCACSSPSSKSSTPVAGEPAHTATTSAALSPAPAGGAQVGQSAPDFTLSDLDGRPFSLANNRGKIIVLEWFNPDCPFVKRNHTEGTLKDEAKKASDQGVVWVSINSNAAGKEGNGIDVNRQGVQRYAMKNPVLLDEKGDVGRSYGAKTTPHIFIIDKRGVLVYRGAVDNAPDGDPRGGSYVNYVDTALADMQAGRPLATSETEPYGCSVKYASR